MPVFVGAAFRGGPFLERGGSTPILWRKPTFSSHFAPACPRKGEGVGLRSGETSLRFVPQLPRSIKATNERPLPPTAESGPHKTQPRISLLLPRFLLLPLHRHIALPLPNLLPPPA